MHYRDGKEAKIGDVVKGTGYNVKGVIVGTVVELTPGTDSCNIRVAHPQLCRLAESVPWPNHELFPRSPDKHYLTNEGGVCGTVALDVEYGQCDAFELVHRPEADGQ